MFYGNYSYISHRFDVGLFDFENTTTLKSGYRGNSRSSKLYVTIRQLAHSFL